MNLSSLIQDLGNDADLICRSDNWLEEQEKYLSTELDRLTTEYKAILAAKRVKRILQNQNMMAIERPDKLSREIEIAKVPEILNNQAQIPLQTEDRILPIMLEDGFDIIQSYLSSTKSRNHITR